MVVFTINPTVYICLIYNIYTVAKRPYQEDQESIHKREYVNKFIIWLCILIPIQRRQLCLPCLESLAFFFFIFHGHTYLWTYLAMQPRHKQKKLNKTHLHVILFIDYCKFNKTNKFENITNSIVPYKRRRLARFE